MIKLICFDVLFVLVIFFNVLSCVVVNEIVLNLFIYCTPKLHETYFKIVTDSVVQ